MHFIIIGSTRCGTTSLYNYLASHPQVKTAKSGPFREVHFFDYKSNYRKGIEWYKSLFPSSAVTGDTSPTMLQHALAPKRVHGHYGQDIKLIVILRDPVKRAYSDYWLGRKKKWITEPFEVSIKKEASRLKHDLNKGKFWRNKFEGSHHHLRGFVERGMYAKHLRGWLEIFCDSIKIIESELLFSQTQAVVNDVFEYLDLEPVKINDRTWHKGTYPPMRLQTQNMLKALFEPHNQELEQLLGRKFTWM